MDGDPLNPTYKLQSCEKRPITPPRFIRDSMVIDIDGAKPKKDKYANIPTKESNKLDDIEGTKSKLRH